MKKGDKEIEGVTDGEKPRRLGPKRANNIRKMFALRKKDDVRKYVVRREIKKGDKTFYKSPRIQRLITEKRLRRKRLEKKQKIAKFKASKEAHSKYEKILSKYIKEKKSHKHEEGADEKKLVAPKPVGVAAGVKGPSKPQGKEVASKTVQAQKLEDKPKVTAAKPTKPSAQQQ